MRTSTMTALLAAHPFFAGMPEQHLGTVVGCATNARFDPGAFLAREGEPADRFFLIRHGTVMLEAFAPGRGRISVQSVEGGGVVGSAWLVPPYRNLLDARAVTLVRAIAFDATCLRGKCDADPALGYALMRRFVPPLVSRLRQLALQSLDVYGVVG